jgi:Lrp/AsnC family leucine-responsive transcriptional regulator
LRTIDAADRRLIAALQRDSRQSMAELAEKVALSPSACHRRIKQLEADGVIQGYGARVDGKALGFEMEFFVEVRLGSQDSATLKAFEAAVRRVPEIMECHLMTGQADYIMRVAAADAADYERFHRECIGELPGVSRIQSSLVIRTIGRAAGYPVRG